MIQAIAFYLFAAVVLVSGALTVSSRNPVHAVMWLILAFFNAAGLMVLCGAEFIAMLLVIVYVGAVAVLFLFVVMMLDIDVAEMRAGLRALLADRACDCRRAGGRDHRLCASRRERAASNWRIAPGRQPAGKPNIEALGDLLYTRYLFLFEGAGPGAAGRDDRRDRAHPPRAQGQPPSERRAAERAASAGRDAQCRSAGGCRGGTVMGGVSIIHLLVYAAILLLLVGGSIAVALLLSKKR